MLTRQGWAAVIIAAALAVVGRALGAFELIVAAAAIAGLVAIAMTMVSMVRLRLEVAREIIPAKVHAGTPSRVDILVGNAGRRRTPVLRLRDQVSGTRGATLLLAPLDAGAEAHAAYRLPTDRRGILTVGPLELVVVDPFGLASVRLPAAGVSELTVFPRIDQLRPVPHTTGDDPHAGADHPNTLGRSGEDFYALRRYVVGDDLRRVHWPSTAKHDELMVRQDELPWQSRATVLVDIRHDTTVPESLELAISAAASIVDACARRQDLVRLVLTDGSDSGFATGHGQIDAVMEHLATVEACPDAGLGRILNLLSRSSSGGALIAVVCDPPRADIESIAALRGRYGSLTFVHFDRSSWDALTPTGAPVAPTALHVTGERSFAQLWNGVAPTGWRPPRPSSGTNASTTTTAAAATAGRIVGRALR